MYSYVFFILVVTLMFISRARHFHFEYLYYPFMKKEETLAFLLIYIMYCIFLYIRYNWTVKQALFIFYLLILSWYKKRFVDFSWQIVSWITCTCHKSHFFSTTKKTHHHRFLSSLSLISIGKGSYCRLQRAVIGVVLAYFRGDGRGEGAGCGYGVWLSANTFVGKNFC